uniref:CASP-like protein n=1 Tax=Aegilops tauschii TaxID=37682 RepID=N1QQ98_AEGTA
MAVGRRLELLVLSSTADSFLLVLEVVFVVCCLEDPYQPSFRLPNQLSPALNLISLLLICCLLNLILIPASPVHAFSDGSDIQGCWPGWEPTNVELLVLIAVEWVVACSTFGSACAALAVDQLAIQHSYCHPEATVCLTYLVAVATACAAGALAAMSALGMLWILASRFRPAHAA